MKVFHCDHCEQLVFFENVRCVRCDHTLAYLPDLGSMGSLEQGTDSAWRCPAPRAENRVYRLCGNYTTENICNWAIPKADADSLCVSCRLTQTIPDLMKPGHKEAWYRLEVAKRRLLYTLLNLSLPVAGLDEDPEHGLAFAFMEDRLTGHNQGVITINVAEVDDAERERRKKELGEPYRTLLGHFRHEVGHYYWNRLIADRRLDAFREIFGDEREDYSGALEQHYREGAPADWQKGFISAYASAHPWEDWAETWAHYVHMADTLETATACGLSLHPPRSNEPSLKPNPDGAPPGEFDRMIESWFSVIYLMNNLNRGMGLPDAYPFALSTAAIAKLAFVHRVVLESAMA